MYHLLSQLLKMKLAEHSLTQFQLHLDTTLHTLVFSDHIFYLVPPFGLGEEREGEEQQILLNCTFGQVVKDRCYFSKLSELQVLICIPVVLQ